MKRRTRNSGCVYTGLVGARMRPPVRRVNRRIRRASVTFHDGPLRGLTAQLDWDSGRTTLPLAPMQGWPAGRYVGSAWVPDGKEAP